MRPWIENQKCRIKGPEHCFACRDSDAWRAQVGLPVECPEGVTISTLPLKTATVVMRRVGCGNCQPMVIQGGK